MSFDATWQQQLRNDYPILAIPYPVRGSSLSFGDNGLLSLYQDVGYQLPIAVVAGQEPRGKVKPWNTST